MTKLNKIHLYIQQTHISFYKILPSLLQFMEGMHVPNLVKLECILFVAMVYASEYKPFLFFFLFSKSIYSSL